MKPPLSLTFNRPFSMRAVDILSTLNYLNYLTSEEADDAGKVRQYADMTRERLKALAELVEPLLWIPEPAAA